MKASTTPGRLRHSKTHRQRLVDIEKFRAWKARKDEIYAKRAAMASAWLAGTTIRMGER